MQNYMEKRQKPEVNWQQVSLIIFDCDGVLTDGRIILGNEMFDIRNFNSRDGIGFSLLKRSSLQAAVISGRSSQALQRRCEEIGIQHIRQGIRNKLEETQNLLGNLNLKWENTVFIGDDWNDIPCMQHCAFSVCPADAPPDIRQLADYVTKASGGKGAVRECIDLVLKNKGIYEQTVQRFLSDITS